MRLLKSKFAQWLSLKRSDEIVGHHRDCHSCPIALFYHEASGGSEIVIFSNTEATFGGYIIDRGYIRTGAPGWAENFMFAVDGDANGQISAGRALEILSHC